MRYTEARSAKITQELLADIIKRPSILLITLTVHSQEPLVYQPVLPELFTHGL
jgi:DNA gyrase/topoisomerase IV subunit A